MAANSTECRCWWGFLAGWVSCPQPPADSYICCIRAESWARGVPLPIPGGSSLLLVCVRAAWGVSYPSLSGYPAFPAICLSSQKGQVPSSFMPVPLDAHSCLCTPAVTLNLGSPCTPATEVGRGLPGLSCAHTSPGSGRCLSMQKSQPAGAACLGLQGVHPSPRGTGIKEPLTTSPLSSCRPVPHRAAKWKGWVHQRDWTLPRGNSGHVVVMQPQCWWPQKSMIS